MRVVRSLTVAIAVAVAVSALVVALQLALSLGALAISDGGPAGGFTFVSVGLGPAILIGPLAGVGAFVWQWRRSRPAVVAQGR